LPAFGKQPNRQVRGLKFEDVTGTTISKKLDKTGFVGGLYKIIEYSGNGCRPAKQTGLVLRLEFPVIWLWQLSRKFVS
jgi:hypothetical protein